MKNHFNAAALTIFGYLGALVPDAASRYAEAFRLAAVECGLQPPPCGELLQKLGRKRLGPIIDEIYPDLAQDNRTVFFAACNSHRNALLSAETLRPGVREALERLQAQNHVLGLFTASLEPMDKVLGHHHIEDFFAPEFIACNPEAVGKDPLTLKIDQLQGLRQAFQAMHGADKPVTVITGTACGCQAARAAGLDVIAYAACDDSYERLRQADADVPIFGDYRLLPDLLNTKRSPAVRMPG